MAKAEIDFSSSSCSSNSKCLFCCFYGLKAVAHEAIRYKDRQQFQGCS